MSQNCDQEFLKKVLETYTWLIQQVCKNQNQGVTIQMNYIVKDDNPAVGVKVQLGEVKDAEGKVITDPSGLKIAISSTDDTAVAVTDNGDGTGSVSFGDPGQASVEVSVTDASGNVLATGSDGFTVTTGDPASIASVTSTFDGLTPVDENPPA